MKSIDGNKILGVIDDCIDCNFTPGNTVNFVNLKYEQCTAILMLDDGRILRCIKKKGHSGRNALHKAISYRSREEAIWGYGAVEVIRW